jgi:putative salt-induced outer membrane protein
MKNTKNTPAVLSSLLAGLCFSPAWCDTVATGDGSIITGAIQQITTDAVVIQTGFAGDISVARGQVKRLTLDAPLSIELADGSRHTATAELGEDGYITIRETAGATRIAFDQMVAATQPESLPLLPFYDPRRWVYTLAGDINGKSGNSDEMNTSILADAVLPGDNQVRLYTSINRGKLNGIESSDEIILGSSFVSYIDDPWGWYVNGELERDEFESIDLRASASTGISYLVFDRPGHRLELQPGLGYRHESYTDDTSDGTPTLNLSLKHMYSPVSWMEMTNTLSYIPSLTDFGDYLLVHDSGINMPIVSGQMIVRLGLKHNYNEPPAAGREELDTLYYTRVLLSFD